MSTEAIRIKGRFPTAAAGIFLALALTVSVLAIQGHSIWSTATHPVVRPPASVQVDDHHPRNDFRPHDFQRGAGSVGSRHGLTMSEIKGRSRDELRH